VTDLKHTVESGEDGDVNVYRVHLLMIEPQTRTFVEEVDSRLFNVLGKGMVLPARLTMVGAREARLGARATFHVGMLFLIFLLPLVVAVVIALNAWPPHAGTLAGSVLTLDEAVRNLVDLAAVPLAAAVRAASENPCRLLGQRWRGCLSAGQQADLVVLDAARRVQAVLLAGRLVAGEM
jgi:hypothetical protein